MMSDDRTASEASILDDVMPAFEYASTGQRFVNYFIDRLLALTGTVLAMLFIAKPLMKPLMFAAYRSGETALMYLVASLWYVVIFMVYVGIYTVTEGASKGRSPGKLITGTRAVKEYSLEPISWKDALLRSLSRMVPFEAFSGLSGYPWHDNWTKTMVIRKR